MSESPDLQPTAQATPPCPHFGPCGGCQLQHLAYTAQLEAKAARLRTLLEASNLVLPELQLHASPPLGYRNRIRLTLNEERGQLRAGYLTAGDRPEFLPISQCPIAAPILWHAAEELVALVNATPGPWLRQPQIRLDQLELFAAPDDALLFTLFLRSPAKTLPAKVAAAFPALCDSLHALVPELRGAGIAVLPPASSERSRRTEVARPGPAWGAPGVNYTVAPGFTYWVPRGAFFQANRFLLPELLALAAACAERCRTEGVEWHHSTPGPGAKKAGARDARENAASLAWDLYAGVGLFSRVLAESYGRVTAVEAAEPAATALASIKLRNLRALKAPTLEFLRVAVVDRDRPDLVVLDPPRTGAGAEICGLLARIAPAWLLYVSCSPEHLALDLVSLAAHGYSIAELHLFDLFPQTSHIETVAVLRRG